MTDSLFFEIALLATGITGLWAGAVSAVEGSSLLCRKTGVSPVVAGLTVIAIGTSLPEISVCMIAALRGSGDIAVGNIVGSNISNICLIAGISAAIAPIQARQGLRAETAAGTAFLLLLIPLCRDGALDRSEGVGIAAFLLPLIAHMYLRQAGKAYEPAPEPVRASSGTAKIALSIAAGLAALGLGSNLVVESAVEIARRAEVTELVIGATVVAVGTSLPELAASLAAVAKKEHGIALGNIAGSNLFNIAILGLTASAVPLKVDPEVPGFQLPFAAAVTALTLPFMKKGSTAGRGAGTVLLLLYAVFIYKIF